MADIKLIASDLDGTFLMNHRQPHPENVRAVHECQKRGIKVCACTGRLWAGARKVIKLGGFDRFAVLNNGASIIDTETGELRFRSRIEPQFLKQILQVGTDAGSGAMVFGYNTVYAFGPTTPHVADRIKEMETYPEDERHEFKVYDNLDDMVNGCMDDAEKITLRMDFIDHFDEVYEKLSKITDLEITSSWVGNVELTSKGGTKAEAVSVLADIYNVDSEEVMTFGDNFNDISMIMWAGVGVAMGNADERLKSIANYVTDRNYNAGVAKAIYKIALNEE